MQLANSNTLRTFSLCMVVNLTERTLISFATLSIRMYFSLCLSFGLVSTQPFQDKFSMRNGYSRYTTSSSLRSLLCCLPSLISSMIRKHSCKNLNFTRQAQRMNVLALSSFGNGLCMVFHNQHYCSLPSSLHLTILLM